MLDALLDWLARLPPAATYPVLMALSALENVFPPVPADVAVALGAFLAQRGELSALAIAVSCWAANTVSAAGMYLLGRLKGPAFFATGWPRRLLPPAAMGALRDAYAQYGVFGIFVSRFLPGVRAAVTPFAGVAGVPPLRALLPAAIASAIWYALIVAAGTALGLQWQALKALVERVNAGLGALAAVLVLALVLWLRRRADGAKVPAAASEP